MPRGLASLRAQTRESAGVDVTTATDITIKDNAVRKIPLSIYGPLGEDLSALLLGRLSTTSLGLFILPGVIDADFTGQIQAMVWTPSPPVYIPAGSRIAQLIPFKGTVLNVRHWGKHGFGSTGMPQIYWTQHIQRNRPTLTCCMKNEGAKPQQLMLQGMIDSGADITIISSNHWPKTWQTTSVIVGIASIGGVSSSKRSTAIIQIIGPEG